MTSENEKEYKEIKAEYEIDTSTEEQESEYNGNSSDSAYILVSEDELMTEGSDTEVNEKDYFDSSSESEESEKSEVAWVDSDDDNDMLRGELDEDAGWLAAEGIQKKIKTAPKNISFKLKRRVFSANCKIKLFKVFEDVKVLVDSFNLIYLIKSFEDFKTYKIDFFKVSDFVYFNKRLVFSSNSCSFMKQLTLDGKVTDIKKGTGNIKKMVAKENLYILGDKLYAFNKNMSLVAEFNGCFVDFCVADSYIACLKEDGDLYLFDLDLAFKNKASFDFKFQFKSVHAVNEMLFISTPSGLYIVDKSGKEIKQFSNTSDAASAFAFNQNFIVHGSLYPNSLRILKLSGLKYFDKFPFSRIKINPISTIAVEDDVFYFSDSRFLSSLRLVYN